MPITKSPASMPGDRKHSSRDKTRRSKGEMRTGVCSLFNRGTPVFQVSDRCGAASLMQLRQRIADAALKHRLPAMTNARQFAQAGLLMSYGPHLADLYRPAPGLTTPNPCEVAA